MVNFDRSFFDTLGVTSERVFGYIYTSTLATFAAWLLDPTPVERLLAAAGPIVATLFVIAFGSGIFGIYFRVIGSLVLFPLTHTIHESLDRLRRRTEQSSVTSTIRFLRGLGVTRPREAYELVKESLPIAFVPGPASSRSAAASEIRLVHAHGEVHFLYITGVITFFVGLFSAIDGRSPTGWLVVAIIAQIAAIIADIRLHTYETNQMRNAESALRELLREHGYLQ